MKKKASLGAHACCVEAGDMSLAPRAPRRAPYGVAAVLLI